MAQGKTGFRGAIALPERMPNPAAEEVIRKMLGLTAKQFRAVLAGEEDLPPATLALLKAQEIANEDAVQTDDGSQLNTVVTT